MKTLVEKLNKIQKELKAPKSQYNSFGKYNYRNCEDILEAVKPLLDGVIVQVKDEVVAVGDRVYIKAIAIITDGEHSIENTAFAREPLSKKGMDESQITGSTSSYARKYALNGLFLIDDTKDADSQDNSTGRASGASPAVPSTNTGHIGDMTVQEIKNITPEGHYAIWADVDFNNRNQAKELGFTFNGKLPHYDKAGNIKTYYSKKQDAEVEKRGKWVKIVSKDEVAELKTKQTEDLKFYPLK